MSFLEQNAFLFVDSNSVLGFERKCRSMLGEHHPLSQVLSWCMKVLSLFCCDYQSILFKIFRACANLSAFLNKTLTYLL